MENGKTKQSQGIRRHLIDAIRNGRANVVTDASEQFGISRQSVHRHLSHLTKNGFLEASGSTRGRTYRLGRNRLQREVYDLSAITEDRVYTADFAYIVDDLAKNVADIWHYGFTEMLNNAIDHSGGTQAHILATRTDEWLILVIRDDGEGIFKRIARLLGLVDPREAILELSKGKLTTDPARHTGEGIFFTSRVFDLFRISSEDLAFSHAEDNPSDFLVHLKQPESAGTTVFMALSPTTDRTLASVFDAFTDSETLDFSKTVVPVRLALYEGHQLISRSQAKRIMNRVERFRHVILDFEGVESVGRSFVDEIFRVFAREHPDVDLRPLGMTPSVRKEIERLYTPRSSSQDKPDTE